MTALTGRQIADAELAGWVEPAQVRPRIDAALAAGGSLVSDEAAPSFWVLADPEGNRVCLCTWQDRA